MKVLVTGHLAYIGVHLVDALKSAGHSVTGCDLELFAGCQWEPSIRPNRELIKDVGELTERDIDWHAAICDLAAIGNDPPGDLDPDLTIGVNRDHSIDLARRAKRSVIDRFRVSGSCSVYGGGEK